MKLISFKIIGTKAVFCLVLLLTFIISPAQNKRLFFDAGIGFRSPLSTLGLGAGFTAGNFDLHLGSSFILIYGGAGFESDIRYNICRKYPVYPTIQIAYKHLFRSAFSIGYDNDNAVVRYAVQDQSSFLPQIGLNYRTGELNDPVYGLVSFNVNYQFPLNTVSAVYVSGIRSEEIEKIINRRYEAGWGFSVTFALSFDFSYLKAPDMYYE